MSKNTDSCRSLQQAGASQGRARWVGRGRAARGHNPARHRPPTAVLLLRCWRPAAQLWAAPTSQPLPAHLRSSASRPGGSTRHPGRNCSASSSSLQRSARSGAVRSPPCTNSSIRAPWQAHATLTSSSAWWAWCWSPPAAPVCPPPLQPSQLPVRAPGPPGLRRWLSKTQGVSSGIRCGVLVAPEAEWGRRAGPIEMLKVSGPLDQLEWRKGRQVGGARGAGGAAAGLVGSG